VPAAARRADQDPDRISFTAHCASCAAMPPAGPHVIKRKVADRPLKRVARELVTPIVPIRDNSRIKDQ
jgi:hypothetical protein